MVLSEPPAAGEATGVGGFCGVHHVAVCCANLEVSLDFYARLLGTGGGAASRMRGAAAASVCVAY